jgi:glyoxylase-like metal-dependent hydrolase (beta-lactamase superfamily II)
MTLLPRLKAGLYLVVAGLVSGHSRPVCRCGAPPSNITYVALSHYHGDHVANASLFAGATWIVQKATAM